jgi:hypothetical protein
MLQITSIAEFMGLQESGQRDLKTIRGKVDGVVAASAYAFNFAERMNRQVTLLSTYELALRKIMNMQNTKNFSDVVNAAKNEPLKIQEAVEQAMIETQETNGGHATYWSTWVCIIFCRYSRHTNIRSSRVVFKFILT